MLMLFTFTHLIPVKVKTKVKTDQHLPLMVSCLEHSEGNTHQTPASFSVTHIRVAVTLTRDTVATVGPTLGTVVTPGTIFTGRTFKRGRRRGIKTTVIFLRNVVLIVSRFFN